MIDLDVSRKERRKASARHAANYKIVKGTTFVGSALLVSSMAAPIMLHPTTVAEATEFQQAATQASPSNFIAQIAPHAQAVANQNDLYASVMMAQAIVESGWGTSTLSCAPNYNLFGIKGSYNGQTVYMNTQEYLNGQWVVKNEPFRKYPSYTESFYDNAYVLRNTSFQSGVYYYAGAWKSNTNSYRDATAYLTGRYATAPNYASALNNVIEAYGLTAYDTPASGVPGGMGGGTVGDTGSTGTDTGSANDQYYTVQSGDSVWLISNKFGISIATLKSWNGMSSDLIHPGQKLIVKRGSGGATSTPSTPGNTGSTGSTGNANTGSSGDQRYTVQSGDSVWLISNKFGISIATLKSWNGMTSDLIHPGQSLIVKKGSGGSTSTPSTPSNTGGSSSTGNTNTGSSGDQRYTVQSGDSVWLISNKYGISIATLKSWNNMTSDLIHPGQSLIVKKGSGGSTSAPSTPSNTGGSSSTGNTNAGSSGDQRYTVQSGDSVWLISNKYGISIATLKSWNNMTSDLIHPGQSLIVKKGSGGSTSAPSNTGSTSNTNNTNTGSTSGGQRYTVQSGDSVWLISNKFGISIATLKSLNGMTSDLIHPGQSLIVKQGSGTTSNAGSSTNTNNTPSSSGKTYKVVSGDTLWDIAQKYGTSIQKIKSLNGLSGDVIFIGQQLKVS